MNWSSPQEGILGGCWLTQWEQDGRKNRKYWEHTQLSRHADHVLNRCPAATASYQLFRQRVAWVETADGDRWRDWSSYVETRYGYCGAAS